MHALIRMRAAATRVYVTHADWGRAALLLFALASLWLTAPANVGLGLSMLAAVFALTAGWRHGARPDAVGLATLALAVWLTLRYGLQCAGFGEPGLVKPQAGYIDWLAPLAFAALAALVPAGQRLRWLQRLWGLAIAGCTLGVLGFLIARGPALLWSGERLGFHLSRPLGIGLYAGVFLVLLAAGARRAWPVAGPWRWPLRIAGFALMALYAQVLVSAQNRTTWLALLLVMAGAAGVLLWRRRRGDARSWRRLLLTGAVAVLGLVAIVYANRTAFEQRYVVERDVVATLGAEGLEAAPVSSITARLRLWRFVLESWPQAPWIGHGFGGMQRVIDARARDHYALPAGESFDHAHNGYLQTLWTQGATGVALWALLVLLLLRDVHRAARVDPRVRAWLPAVWGTLGFVAVWACFDYRLSHPDMRCFSILLLLSLRLLGQAGTDGPAPPSSCA